LRFLALASAAALAAACALALPQQGGARRSASSACGKRAYSYAGLDTIRPVDGVRATITALTRPRVERGHAAGWIGVAGTSAGGSEIDEWIQIGLSAFPGDPANHVYVEFAQPDRHPRYIPVRATPAVGESHRFAVRELHGHPGWWRAWLDGKRVGPAVRLPGSHTRWSAQMTGESWNAGSGVCNLFSYAFGDVSLATSGPGSWTRLAHTQSFEDRGYRLVRSGSAGFVASSLAVPSRFLAGPRR
jgi:hypothetical protein